MIETNTYRNIVILCLIGSLSLHFSPLFGYDDNIVERQKRPFPVRGKILDKNNNVLASTRTDETRSYAFDRSFSHLTGYAVRDDAKGVWIGKSGLEKEYDAYLNQGKTLSTSIDIKVQNALEKVMHDRTGAIMIMDARNGEIIGAVSAPYYDASDFSIGITTAAFSALVNDVHKPLTNRLVNGLYPPGPIILPSVALAFLDANRSTNTVMQCNGDLILGNRRFKTHGTFNGKVDLETAVTRECERYFYKSSLFLGVDRMARMFRKFGLGSRTGIDLPNEFHGNIADGEWKHKKRKEPWYLGETIVTAVGLGYTLVTPIQVACYTASLATGKKILPHFFKNDQDNGEGVLDMPIPKENLQLVRRAMYRSFNMPEGRYYRSIHTLVEVAGVGGVLDKHNAGSDVVKNNDTLHDTWLSIYFPSADPRYVATLILENSDGSGKQAAEIMSEAIDSFIKIDLE